MQNSTSKYKKNILSQRFFSLFAFRFKFSEGGYLLLFAVVLASIVLAIGLGIFNIINKGLVLASSGRASQVAFYAADTGAECALYWDRKHSGFSATVFPTSTASTVITEGPVCNNENIAGTWIVSEQTGNSAKTTFKLNLANGTCAIIAVLKTGGGAVTFIESFGYNTCTLTNPRRIERAIRVKY
ncbi:MAG: hypothetical protein Q8R36_01430 [bacterium]|nr:hypothetical protein [bacterium]